MAMSKLTHIISAVLGIDESTITPDLTKDSVVTWDSFNAIILLTEIENSFGVKFSVESGLKAQNVADLMELLRSAGKDPAE
jgi:acyl carrier protein